MLRDALIPCCGNPIRSEVPTRSKPTSGRPPPRLHNAVPRVAAGGAHFIAVLAFGDTRRPRATRAGARRRHDAGHRIVGEGAR